MDLDGLLLHYLGVDEPSRATPQGLAEARQRISLDFGLERDAGRRFALWSLLAVLGDPPDPRDAFEDAKSRDAAFAFSRLLRHGDEDDAAG